MKPNARSGPVGTLRAAVAVARNTWRGLTSMRTALILLFLLALAALPGALLPQRSLNAPNVADYLEAHPTLGPVLDALGLFDVFATPWFAAIYVLLFVSLIGCVVPRSMEYLRQCRARPVKTPANLTRLPLHEQTITDVGQQEMLSRAHRELSGWRRVTRDEKDGSVSISAERGYLREAGNLVFHTALLGLLLTFAITKMFGYEGNVIVGADGSQFCNTGIVNYDSFDAGVQVDGTNLNPFCVRVNNFHASYRSDGQAESFASDVDYQTAETIGSGNWNSYDLQVNEPLRLESNRVYLLGHGYSPTFTVTYPDGQQRTQTVQWRPVNQTTLLSEGATKFDPPGVSDPVQRRKNQLAVTGLFAPTANLQGKVLSSGYPALRDPAVAVDVMRGDLGINDGTPQSIFRIDQTQVRSGELQRVARENLRPGEQIRLDDGTSVRFDGVQQWVSLQISHGPAQLGVLIFAVLVLFGLGASLSIKRRRLWVRVGPPDEQGRSLVHIGGLARTDQAGYGEEFRSKAHAVATGVREGKHE